MLLFCSEKNILPIIQKISIEEVNKTHENLVKSLVRYRYVIDMSTLTKLI